MGVPRTVFWDSPDKAPRRGLGLYEPYELYKPIFYEKK